MSDCLRVRVTWVCPICGRHTAVLEGESDHDKPFVCDGIDRPHRMVEMEQRLSEAFDAERQYRPAREDG